MNESTTIMITRNVHFQPEAVSSTVTSSEGDTGFIARGRGSPRSRKGNASDAGLRSKKVILPKNKKSTKEINPPLGVGEKGMCSGMRHFKRYHAKSSSPGLPGQPPVTWFSCRHGTGYMPTHKLVDVPASDKRKWDISNPYQALYGLEGSPSADGESAHIVLPPEDSVKGRRNAKKKEKCAASTRLAGKARKIVKLLAVEQDLKVSLGRKLPYHIECGQLRSVVRSMYEGQTLTCVQELSIKTSMKAEVQPCAHCKLDEAEKIDKWKKKRLDQPETNGDALDRFSRAFASNVELGWNRKKNPYVPNGHATMNSRRMAGGNWCEEAVSSECRVELVHSGGKPRIITLFAEGNVAVLTPLHNSLYASLKGRGWLLLGNPTEERLRQLDNARLSNRKEWLSFDYSSATDNIKTAYVRRAVEILISKGEGLSDDEVRCMRLFASLSLDGACAGSGQPMGSPMSFPVLCLINKTVVDLALTELLREGKISFKEWTSHRCLINGDDLLTMNTSKGDLVEKITKCGLDVGLITNKEKTMRSPEYGEINSTVFKNCVQQKKTNVAALWMAADVTDVIGYGIESTVSPQGLTMVLRNNVSRLARQKIKTARRLPWTIETALVRDAKIVTALRSQPASEVPEATNLFPVVTMPDGYDLTREEEAEALTEEVIRVRQLRLFEGLHDERKTLKKKRLAIPIVVAAIPDRRVYKVLRPKKTIAEERTLRIFVSKWENKQKEELIRADERSGYVFPYPSSYPVLDQSKIEHLSEMIKAFKDKRKQQAPSPSAWDPVIMDEVCHIDYRPWCPISEGIGVVSLADAEN